MNFPWTIHIGSAAIPAHALFETAAFFTGFRYFLFLRRRKGDNFDSQQRGWIILGALFGALAGSRLLGALEQPVQWAQSPHPWLYLYANKTVLGGFLGGLFGVEAVKKLIGERRASGDLFVYPMLLALIIGRIGCFSMGVYEETYGNVSSLPWALDLGDHVPRHPVALYEIAFCVLLWPLLKRVQRTVILAPGALFKLFMIAYLSFRFALDFIKPHYTVFPGLSPIQLATLLGLLYYLPYLLQPKKLTAVYA